jgi:hypothetical protein
MDDGEADAGGGGDGDGEGPAAASRADGDATPGGDGEGPSAGAEEVTAAGVTARYYETERERVLAFERDGRTAVVAQNVEGYAMLKVRPTVSGDELERYYGFDMALDHAAELLGVAPNSLPVPDGAADMGM